MKQYREQYRKKRKEKKSTYSERGWHSVLLCERRLQAVTVRTLERILPITHKNFPEFFGRYFQRFNCGQGLSFHRDKEHGGR